MQHQNSCRIVTCHTGVSSLVIQNIELDCNHTISYGCHVKDFDILSHDMQLPCYVITMSL